MTAPRTLLIARPRAGWSRQVCHDLDATHGVTPTWSARTIPEAFALLETDTPDLVLVLQETSDEFSCHDIQQLLARWPLARLLVCHGPWCNGDGRNRADWPLATRISHTAVAPRLVLERQLLNGAGEGLPWTAGRDEIAAADFAANPSAPTEAFTFHVASSDNAWKGTLALQLAALGGIAIPEITIVDLLLVDVDPWDGHRLGELAELFRATTPRSAVLLTNTPDAIPRSRIASTLERQTDATGLDVHDKLAAATRPADLAASLATTRARRSA